MAESIDLVVKGLEALLTLRDREDIGNLISQLKPFWVISSPNTPEIVKSVGFDEKWALVVDENGSYRDNLGHRVAVRKRLDDGSLSTVNDIHWGAYHVAKLWIELSAASVKSEIGEQPSILWRHMVKAIKHLFKEEVYDLALREMTLMKAQSDIKMSKSPTPDAYLYPALLRDPSAIRLVVLLPSMEVHTDIVCRLCNSSLNRSHLDRYEALSYVWGDASRRKSITVESQQFQATENLESALRHLRYRDKPRVLWIDAICINQNNIAERNAQVQQMDLIYKGSQRVIVWLGPESEDSNDAMEYLRDHPDLLTAFTNQQHRREYCEWISLEMRAIGHLLARPWFSRIWCIQEFILGPHAVFQCGRQELPWRELMSIFALLRDIARSEIHQEIKDLMSTRTLIDHGTKSDTEMISMIMKSDEDKEFKDYAIAGVLNGRVEQQTTEIAIEYDNSFLRHSSHIMELLIWKSGEMRDQTALDLLCDFHGWHATDPRDMVFALYGIVHEDDPDRNILKPDYSLTVSELYTNLAIYFLQNHRDLSILSIATSPVKNFADVSRQHWLPCWVPDWRESPLVGFERTNYYHIASKRERGSSSLRSSMFDPSLGLKASPISLQDDDQVLCLDGIDIDTIIAIGEVYLEQQTTPIQLLQTLNRWKKVAQLSNEKLYPHTGQPICEAFWRTLLFDIQVSAIERNSSNKSDSVMKRFPTHEPEFSWFVHYPPSLVDDAKLIAEATKSTRTVNGRRFFRTARGMFGLGPATAKMGDHVVVLFGGEAPFILRDLGWHQLVGEW